MTVALIEGQPEVRGHIWTAEDYAKRDAALAALGIKLRPRDSRRSRATSQRPQAPRE